MIHFSPFFSLIGLSDAQIAKSCGPQMNCPFKSGLKTGLSMTSIKHHYALLTSAA